MTGYRLTSKAKVDLRSIWSYIAFDDAEAANSVEQAIHQACAFLAESPLRGHSRRDLTRLPVRFWTLPRYPKYMIVFDPATRPLKILRILHGARNVNRELKRKPLQ